VLHNRIVVDIDLSPWWRRVPTGAAHGGSLGVDAMAFLSRWALVAAAVTLLAAG
jgi:hypothetical protein